MSIVCRHKSVLRRLHALMILCSDEQPHPSRSSLRGIEWEIRNMAEIAEIGNGKALFPEQIFVDGLFQDEWNNIPTSKLGFCLGWKGQ